MAHEQSDRYTNSDCNHGSPNIHRRAIGTKTSSLREAGRHQEEHTGNHGSEGSTSHFSRIYVSQETDSEGTNGRDDIRAIEDVMIGDFIGSIRGTGDGDHDRKFLGFPRLEVCERGQDREGGDDDELSPRWKWLQIPRERSGSIATCYDILEDETRGICVGKRSEYRCDPLCDIVGRKGADHRGRGCHFSGKGREMVSRSRIKQQI